MSQAELRDKRRRDFQSEEAKKADRCRVCGHTWYPSLLRVCPVSGVVTCLYCCKRKPQCEHLYRAFGGGIYGCRAYDKEHKIPTEFCREAD